MLLSFCSWTALLILLVYLLFKFSFVRTWVKVLFAKFLAWDTARQAKLKGFNKQLIQMKKDLFQTMPQVLQDVDGPVLEIGAGSGALLPYYPLGTRLQTIDLNEFFRPYLDVNLSLNLHVTLVNYLLGNDMSGVVDDNSCSCVISSLVLCCADQGKALAEIYRVLKPGGRFYFIEHIVEQPGTWVRWFQENFTSTWENIRGNCCLTHPTDENIKKFDGFVNLNAEILYRNLAPQYFFCHKSFVGFADKPK